MQQFFTYSSEAGRTTLLCLDLHTEGVIPQEQEIANTKNRMIVTTRGLGYLWLGRDYGGFWYQWSINFNIG